MDVENIPTRTTPNWASYQHDLWMDSVEGKLPTFSTDPGQLEEKAQEKLSLNGWYYASSNAGRSWTHRANREAFYRHQIIPRMLVYTDERDTTTALFQRRIPAPVMFAPIGINKIYHSEGELPVAAAARELGLPYSLSTAASQSIEDVASANGSGSPRYYQLYLPHDDELAINIMTRAFQCGFEGLMMTLDTWQLGWRHQDLATGNYAFYHGVGAELGLSDRVFQERLRAEGIDPKSKRASQRWIDSIWHGRSFSWEKISWVRDTWKKISGGKPFLLKGVQDGDDAMKSIEYGCDGIVVSNHAGRQVDGAIASLDALEKIRKTIGPEPTIIFDSGVRSGSDIFKAISLGANVVETGRMWIWGLTLNGKAGVLHVMRSLLAEFDLTMHLAGVTSISEITADRLHSLPNVSLNSSMSKL